MLALIKNGINHNMLYKGSKLMWTKPIMSPVREGLICWVDARFQQNNILTDLSGWGNNCDISGNIMHGTNTIVADYLAINTEGELPQELTLHFRGTFFREGISAFISKRTSFHDGFFVFNYNSPIGLHFDIGGSESRKNTGVILTPNIFYTITLSIKGNIHTMYVDGQVVGEFFGKVLEDVNAPLYLLSDCSKESSYRRQGTFASFMCYNRALKPDEVKTLHEYEVTIPRESITNSFSTLEELDEIVE